jgi:hypothetical protein
MLWLVIKGAKPPALDATASSPAAGQSEAKNCQPFVPQNRPGHERRAQNKIAKGIPPGVVLALCITRRDER